MRFPLLALAGLLLACGDRDSSAGDGAGTAAGAEGPRGTASIAGTIRFEGTAPANPAIDMSGEPACRAKHDGTPRDPQTVVNDGRLANSFVHVRGGLPQGARYNPPTEPAVIDQDGCIYEPRVLGVMVGQPLEIRNSDALLHNIKAVPTENRGFNISQPSEGMRTTRTFNTSEVMVPLECNVHGWMKAYVGVMNHPYFAVSGEDGSFTIENLPAGTYEIEAWHERFGRRTATVTVGEGESATAELVFSPTTT